MSELRLRLLKGDAGIVLIQAHQNLTLLHQIPIVHFNRCYDTAHLGRNGDLIPKYIGVIGANRESADKEPVSKID